jgi:hypothetical protein
VHIRAAVPTQFMAQIKSGICRWDNDTDWGERIADLERFHQVDEPFSRTGV